MLKYWLWLTNLPGIGNQTRLSLLEHFGTPEDIFFADSEEYALVADITRPAIAALANKSFAAADQILGDCEKLDIRLLTLQDADYPARLKNIYDPPCLLYTKGRIPLFDEQVAVAVVGTRDATPYGIASAEKLAYGLAKNGALVVSGLAKGIDAAAHRAALRAGGLTAAVLGGGIDVLYPPQNRYLYEDIAASGVLISEYPPGTEALGRHFPIRNRIISGLCLATLVVEAPEHSGALITAGTALEQSRDVFAVPGPIDAPMSRGCNHLIREGAGLCADSWDILREYATRYPNNLTPQIYELPETLAYVGQKKPVETGAPKRPILSLSHNDYSLTDDQIRLLRAMGDTPVQADDLIELTQIPARRVLSALTLMELEDLVSQQSGKHFLRLVTLAE